MQLDQNLYDIFQDKARQTTITTLNLGLAYTAVVTSDGGIGVAHTCLEQSGPCGLAHENRIYEGHCAADLLPCILEADPLKRSMALALINALNHSAAVALPEDTTTRLFEHLKIGHGTRVAMVGYFGPLMPVFQEKGAVVEAIDRGRAIGDPAAFQAKLHDWADVLLLTSTSILNQSTEEILGHTSDTLRTVILGPSTPMVPDAFASLPVNLLAGTVPLDSKGVLQCIRHGAGTRSIHKFSRKAFTELG